MNSNKQGDMADHTGVADIADGGEIGDGQRKEIYTYQAPWTVYAMAWSHRYVRLGQVRLGYVRLG